MDAKASLGGHVGKLLHDPSGVRFPVCRHVLKMDILYGATRLGFGDPMLVDVFLEIRHIGDGYGASSTS